MKELFTGAISGLIIGILLAVTFYSCNKPEQIQSNAKESFKSVTKDSSKIPDPVTPKPIIITQIKARIDTVFKNDTLYLTRSFTGSLDTIAQGDTLNVRFYYPQNTFDLALRRKQDSILVIKETVVETIIEKTNPRFSVGVNASYGVGPDKKFQPYIGAGISLNLFSF